MYLRISCFVKPPGVRGIYGWKETYEKRPAYAYIHESNLCMKKDLCICESPASFSHLVCGFACTRGGDICIYIMYLIIYIHT